MKSRHMTLTRPVWPLLRLWLIFWFSWARKELQKKNPHHPDLFYIVHRLNELKEKA